MRGFRACTGSCPFAKDDFPPKMFPDRKRPAGSDEPAGFSLDPSRASFRTGARVFLAIACAEREQRIPEKSGNRYREKSPSEPGRTTGSAVSS